jgi:hypothetical protein
MILRREAISAPILNLIPIRIRHLPDEKEEKYD